MKPLPQIAVQGAVFNAPLLKEEVEEQYTPQEHGSVKKANQTISNQYIEEGNLNAEGRIDTDVSILDEQISKQEIRHENTSLEDEKGREKLPGEEVDFQLKLHTSTHHLIEGKARSDIGDMLLKSRLMPSNEVKLSIKLKQSELDDIELLAYIDIANFTMELDGANSVLNRDHKRVLKYAVAHLRPKFEVQYKDYDFPEHALMLVQMLGYWSVSPEGYMHEKRSIVSQ